jgi:hypothetical protein
MTHVVCITPNIGEHRSRPGAGRSLWVVLLLLTIGCDLRVETPPHPPPDPTLDIVVVGTRVQINGHSLDTTNVTDAQVVAALGEEPFRQHDWLHFRNRGVSLGLKERRFRALEVTLTPRGQMQDQGMAAFKGRFIVNGAWIHPDAEIYHIEAEMDYPCNQGNQGVGKFSGSSYPGSYNYDWHCTVGGQPFSYWLKRYYDEEHPLFAFGVEFHDQPHPPRPPLPEFSWSDAVRLPGDLVALAIAMVKATIEWFRR